MSLSCYLGIGIVVAFYAGCFLGAFLMQKDMIRIGFGSKPAPSAKPEPRT